MNATVDGSPELVIEIIVAVVALWGAGLSTYEAVQRRKTRPPDVKVHASIGVPQGAPDNTPRLILFVRNHGEQEVFLVHAGLFFVGFPWKYLTWDGPKRQWDVQKWTHAGVVPRPNYPVTLPNYQSVVDLMELAEVAKCMDMQKRKGLARIRVCVVDAVGNVYRSNAVEFKPGEWI